MPKSTERSPLEKIDDEIERLRETILNARAEIRELESAAAILRRLDGTRNQRSFAGKKIRECAEILLRERSPQHFRDLAIEAIARGYRSQKGGDTEIIAKSFWSTLKLFSKLFEKVGTGKFRLIEKKPGASATTAK